MDKYEVKITDEALADDVSYSRAIGLNNLIITVNNDR